MVVGSALFGAAVLVDSLTRTEAVGPGTQAFSRPGFVLLALGAILVMVALPGMYAHQASAAGWLGLAGYGLLQVGWVFVLVYAVAPLMYPDLASNQESAAAFLLGIALSLGLVLTSIATIRAGVFPFWAGVLLLGTSIGFMFGFFVAEFLPAVAGQVGGALLALLFGGAWIWVGVTMWRGPATR